ncbi:ribosome maturation factor RimP [Aerococcus kribbianus]|uniref:Ribosome maturation factor RimP n=1 Tax=Aerococcus kribbianus TaxID=2999064 RepID=A0A9X3FM53_9LACT|nr:MULTISPECIES: ribosome maturation factor RimP [unclassified Aerococcus]MCZ0716769.1 ribosome maturation factor RimP [Aerococcus sp. YH-aer221]MCZ0725057.1 ribosome maturation factor RimP [Aerococcus sp. YH-aer222]
MAKITDQVSKLAQPILADLGFELYDVEYVKEGKAWFLRVYIDKPEEGGISLDDCVLASEHLSQAIDQEGDDFIKGTYYLEVSSPGAERPLKTEEQVNQAIGEWVYASFYQAIDGEKDIQGRLLANEEDHYIIEKKVKTRRQEVSVPKDKVSLLRLAIEF